MDGVHPSLPGRCQDIRLQWWGAMGWHLWGNAVTNARGGSLPWQNRAAVKGSSGARLSQTRLAKLPAVGPHHFPLPAVQPVGAA